MPYLLPERPPSDRWTPPATLAPRRGSDPGRREHIRRVGAGLFATEGVSAVSLARLAATAGMYPIAMTRLYASPLAVLEDVLNAFLEDLANVVGAAHDAAHAPGADRAPERRLELVVRGFIEAVSRHRDEHRCFQFCVHRLGEQERGSALLRYQIVLEWLRDLLQCAVPALAEDAHASATMLETVRALLSDPWRWQSSKGPGERADDARRITAILLATAVAETTGVWPALGKTTGAGVRALTLDVRTARARMSEVLKAAELGADIAITRHGRRVARVVAAA